jgi:hypothetical protein
VFIWEKAREIFHAAHRSMFAMIEQLQMSHTAVCLVVQICSSYSKLASWLISGFSHLVHAGLWYTSWRVQTRAKPSDFLCEKILSMPSFGGELKPSIPCHSFVACKKPLQLLWKSHCRLNFIGHFLPLIPHFADRGLSCRLMRSTL